MPIDTETLAQEIFVKWATQAGPTNWQWDEMAQASLNAANRFAAIVAQAATLAQKQQFATAE